MSTYLKVCERQRRRSPAKSLQFVHPTNSAGMHPAEQMHGFGPRATNCHNTKNIPASPRCQGHEQDIPLLSFCSCLRTWKPKLGKSNHETICNFLATSSENGGAAQQQGRGTAHGVFK